MGYSVESVITQECSPEGCVNALYNPNCLGLHIERYVRSTEIFIPKILAVIREVTFASIRAENEVIIAGHIINVVAGMAVVSRTYSLRKKAPLAVSWG